MATMQESMLTWVVAQLRGQGLTPYLDVAPQGATTWPLCTVSISGSQNNYSLQQGQERVELFQIRVNFFDREDQKNAVMLAAQAAETALENLPEIAVLGNKVMGTDKMAAIGPRWLGREHYWAMSLGWQVYMSGSVAGLVNSKLVISGEVAIPVGATSVSVPALGFIPGGITVSVNKPTAGQDNIFATVILATVGPGGCTVELSAAPTTAGYVLSYVATS